jgi:hypothetical protein
LYYFSKNYTEIGSGRVARSMAALAPAFQHDPTALPTTHNRTQRLIGPCCLHAQQLLQLGPNNGGLGLRAGPNMRCQPGRLGPFR